MATGIQPAEAGKDRHPDSPRRCCKPFLSFTLGSLGVGGCAGPQPHTRLPHKTEEGQAEGARCVHAHMGRGSLSCSTC